MLSGRAVILCHVRLPPEEMAPCGCFCAWYPEGSAGLGPEIALDLQDPDARCHAGVL